MSDNKVRFVNSWNSMGKVTILEKQYWQLLDIPGPGASEPATDYVTILEKQYWQLLDIPGPGASEPATDYVMRVMEILDDAKATPQRSGISGLLSATFSVDKTRDATLYESIKSSFLSNILII
uniref:ANF_receptor domain-containing protein n=1 Tax=Ascaris lumbricoides TaxID=6252 RepID=A0A0M3IWT7_ASCLU